MDKDYEKKKKKKKNPKRFECLKRKAKELSILCDVEVLFLCKEDDSSANSFDSWPEDRNSCLSLIDKYKNCSVPGKSCNKKSTALGKRKQRSENAEFEMGGFVDGIDFDVFYGEFCESVEATQTDLCENGGFEVGFVDGFDLDDFNGNFFESVQETQNVRCNNVQQNAEFDLGFVEGLAFDELIREGEETQIVLCENVKDFDRLELSFVEGLSFDDENCVGFCELIQESEKSEIVLSENAHDFDATLNVLGHQQLLEVLTRLDSLLDRAQPQNH